MIYQRMRRGQYRWLTIPPPDCRWNVIRLLHEQLGHCGSLQTYRQLRQHFLWPGLRSHAAAFCACCDACQRRRFVLPDPPETLQEPIVYGPFRGVHVDLTGPFETPLLDVQGSTLALPADRAPRALAAEQARTRKVLAWIMLMIDYFTKVIELEVIYFREAICTARAFYNAWVTRYGAPACVTSDNGSEFDAEFHHMLHRMSVTHIRITPGHPAANGAVERLVRSIKAMLATHVNGQPEHWVQSLPHVRGAYMARLHAAIGVSPNEMLMGCKARLPLPVASAALPDLSERLAAQLHLTRLVERLHVLEDAARSAFRDQFTTNLTNWQRRAARAQRDGTRPLAVGDWVLELLEGPVPALASRFGGPFQIIALNDSSVQLCTDTTAFRERRTCWRARDRVVRYTRKSDVIRDLLTAGGN